MTEQQNYFWLCWVCTAFSGCSDQGLLIAAVHGLLIVVASLVADHGLWACGLQLVVACELQLTSLGSVVATHRLSCSMTCGLFPHLGLNPCPLHWQVDSYLLCMLLGKSPGSFLWKNMNVTCNQGSKVNRHC